MHSLARFGVLIPVAAITILGSVVAHAALATPAQPALAAGSLPATEPLDQYSAMPSMAPYTVVMPLSAVTSGVLAPRVAQAANGVRIASFAFSPQAITVSVGQSVVWTNADSVPHTATSDTGMWNSGVIAPGASYSMTFSTPGTFTYRCTIHPFMTGTVTVVAGQTSATAPAALAPSTGLSVSYGAGWNLVSGPAGMILSGTSGPLYTLRAGDTAYETVPAGTPLAANVGYWAYFNGPSTETLALSAATPVSIPLPAGQYVLIGNSSSMPMTVAGADSVLTYDPLRGYQSATVLQPGQGAWAYSRAGGALSMQP
jgi:plastocyanin